ncbi:MAG: response regulator [Candidatus Schekmanbacteria bacterium RBG_13_48_7]|uniref:Response regulator n=1 Tax=Candidatus Schekmanbacteria bacterium RBG_13_48_7 TaxID=1817878 RepID=A0A1F7RL47_9BACT|nr:MAG: response regulator [Candidatus Schekmanbacteria bacterium RBG_13_48_7]
MDKLKVLLVDDEEELVDTWVERLIFRGIDAEGVTNGTKALEVLKGKKFDVVVIDVKMPGLGGLEVMKRIRKEHPNVKVILITGHGSVKNGEEGLQEGAFDYLAKPVKLEDLIEKMKEAAEAD